MSFSHDFSHDIVRVHYVDVKKNAIVRTYIFVGNIDDRLRAAFDSYEKKINSGSNAPKMPPAILNFYGKKIRSRFELPKKLVHGGDSKKTLYDHENITGGDDDTDDLSEEAIDEVVHATIGNVDETLLGGSETTDDNKETTDDNKETTDDNKENTDDNKESTDDNKETTGGSAVLAYATGGKLFEFQGKKIKVIGGIKENTAGIRENTGGDDDFDITPFETEISLDDIADISTNANAVDMTKEEEAIATANAKLKFVYSGVYPLDTILDLKYKIYLSAGIPIYRQHLWASYDRKLHPLSYTISVSNHHIHSSIEELVKYFGGDKASLTDVEGVPVNMYFYRNKDFITTRAYDTITLLRFLYEQHGVLDYYVADLNDMFDATKMQRLLNDKYMEEIVYYGFINLYFPMMTMSVFHDYITSESSLSELYPKLKPEKLSVRSVFDNEAKITECAFHVTSDKKIENALGKKLFSSIKETKLTVDNFRQDVDLLLNLRDLFDSLRLDDYMTYVKASILHNENTIGNKYQNIILHKSYHREQEPKEAMVVNSILIKMRLNLDTNEHMFISFFKNGNFVIHSKWREEQHMTFATITEVVAKFANPIIDFINNNKHLKYHNIEIPKISKSNSVFTETGFSFHYNADITDAHYKVLKSILHDYVRAGIITEKETKAYVGVAEDEGAQAVSEYFFNKGMHKFDVSRLDKSITTNNYYEFLSNVVVFQKWKTIFENTRTMVVTNMLNRIKVEISGIRNQVETEIFHMYLLAMFYLFEENTKNIGVDYGDISRQRNKRLLKNLKSSDPLLYNLKIYRSPIVYSKICQKPYQPVMLTDNEYKKLPDGQRTNTIKYWNFTRQEPVWYRCPNAKYPHIKFITNQHPSGFCIPCCKKLEMNERVNQKKQEIHKKCLTDHVYSGEKLILTKGNHYIATYGKPIEVGRLSRLPENTLEPLFFDTYSPSGGMDSECFKSEGYYIMGIDQNTKSLSKVGLIYCIMHALKMSLQEFLAETQQRINANPEKFAMLLDGNMPLYFNDAADLVRAVATIDGDITTTISVNWNDVFKSIAYHYFGVNTIVFNDRSKEHIELALPNGLTTVDEMFPETHLNLVVIAFRNNYYPIYLVNAELYKKTGIIETRLFVNISGIIAIIHAIIRKSLENSSGAVNRRVDLSTYKKFIASQTDYRITKYYVNRQNYCYAIGLSSKAPGLSSKADGLSSKADGLSSKADAKADTKSLFLPVENSYYSPDGDIELVFAPLEAANLVDFTRYQGVMRKFNKWVAAVSAEQGLENITIYHPISVQQWLVYNSNVIGFVSNDLYYYIRPIKEAAALKFVNAPMQHTLHNPLAVNKMLSEVSRNSRETKSKYKIGWSPQTFSTIQHDLYLYNLYRLVLLQFISLFKKQKNVSLRRQLLAIVAKTRLNKDTTALRNFINGVESFEDKEKLKSILSRASRHNDKKKIIADIDEGRFEFDNVEFERLRQLPVPAIQQRLVELSRDIITVGKIPRDINFSNMLSACSIKRTSADETAGYCDGGKLIVPKEQFQTIIEILANDIANDFKQKWLFNEVFVNKYVLFFKFQRRPNETIYIELAE